MQKTFILVNVLRMHIALINAFLEYSFIIEAIDFVFIDRHNICFIL